MDINGSTTQKLIFIYNADSGLGNTLLDGVHKIVSPGTYACSLCSLTFGAFAEKFQWKRFRKESALEMEFLYKDEFNKQYASKFGYKFSFPVVLAETDLGLEICVNSEEINVLKDVEDLMKLIKERI